MNVEKTVLTCCKLALGGPLGHDQLDKVFQRDTNSVYRRLCYHLARALEPDVVVELGVYAGHTTVHLAAGWPAATVLAVDVGLHERFESNTSWCGNVEFRRARSTDPDLLASVEDGSVGLLLVDTVHSWDHALGEVEAWTPKMADGGVFLLDDLEWDDGMRTLLGKLLFERKGELEDMHPRYGFGYAVVP